MGDNDISQAPKHANYGCLLFKSGTNELILPLINSAFPANPFLSFEMDISSTRNHCAEIKYVESELAGLIVGCIGQICCRIRFKPES